ncbi:hypothetical protein [Nocardioides sp. MH1]|uniref:hypothetical protein n=1 Tax=Nocardioides sp. MH1 TaxID=3242490 RepID=UPI0035200B8C
MNRGALAAAAGVVLGLLVPVAAVFGALLYLDEGLRDHWYWLAAGAVGAGVLALLIPSPPAGEAAPAAAGLHRAPQPPASRSAGPAPSLPSSLPASPPVAGQAAGLVALSSVSFTLPKAGASDDENDDASAVAPETGRAAVADGASSSYNAGAWARWLCERWVTDSPAFDGAALTAWALTAASGFRELASPDQGSWLDQAAGDSHATFVGLAVQSRDDTRVWRAVAVGDALVVQLRSSDRGLHMVTGFPYESAAGADGAPLLLSSGATTLRQVPSIRLVEGLAETGDSWLLLTDEMARWALSREAAGAPVWELISAGGDPLRSAIADARDSGAVVNDDMTVVVLATA